MGAKQERTIRVSQPYPTVAAAIVEALQTIGADVKVRAPEQGLFEAKMGMTVLSAGERLTVRAAAESPTASVVNATSEAFQLLDFSGKNTQNLDRFQLALHSSVASLAGRPAAPPASSVAVPLAPVEAAPPRPVPAQPAASLSAKPAPRIFVSYRRDDSAIIVGRICDRIARDLGADSVFKDVDDIPFGVDFFEYLDHEVQKCSVLLAVIGPEWLTAAEGGRRRLDDPNDFVRIEIASALRRGIPVVPVLVDGARMPSADVLPEELKRLARRNGTVVRHDPDFHPDMTRLLSRLG